jgi:NAD(P)H dehydrogenase (quinone)
MILVTGATGGFGQEVLKNLTQKTNTNQLAALARNPEKLADYAAKGVSVLKGDYNDEAALIQAFKGIDKLMFVSGNEIGKRLQQHTNVVNASIKAGVKHIIYTSFQRKNDNTVSPISFITNDHIETEKLLKTSGLQYTILRHALYLEVLPLFLGQGVLETGVFFPAGDGRAAFAARADMAEAAANVLLSDEHINQTYDISAPVTYSFDDVAKALSAIHGSEVPYVSPSINNFKQVLTDVGVPADLIGMSVGFAGGIAAGEFNCASSKLEELLGRAPITPKEFLAKVYRG